MALIKKKGAGPVERKMEFGKENN
ncbi:hypothetical protein CCACVL1_08653 [Corchorus capsularis]|uniref:Uncharacterized protein n=1 Tax=Corchorus capsularis TaxID=210143 RepID=A0A1R3IZD2_COCAP|nr:hypothetical protein CCACVL1_08653 [Corchorus capsularis]